MNLPKISVIIPVYNTEAYVAEAVRSITSQTLREIEVLIVDDGSTDGSLAVIGQLAAEDGRIRIFTQPNAGQSAARNKALEQVQGEYVYFMDSDDVLEADALELCYRKCNAERLDFVLFDAEVFGNDSPLPAWLDYHRASSIEDRIYNGAELFDRLLASGRYRCSVCLNVIRTGLLRERELVFLPGIIHEDELFTALLYWQAERVGRIDRAFFKRRLRAESTMTSTFSMRNLTGYLTVAARLRAYAAGHDRETRRRAGRLIGYLLNPALRNAWALPAHQRLWALRQVALRFPEHLQIKSLAVVMLKSPLSKLGGKTPRKPRPDTAQSGSGYTKNPDNR